MKQNKLIKTLHIPPEEWTGGLVWLASVSLLCVLIFPILYLIFSYVIFTVQIKQHIHLSLMGADP